MRERMARVRGAKKHKPGLPGITPRAPGAPAAPRIGSKPAPGSAVAPDVTRQQYLTVYEAADLVKVSPASVRRWLGLGTLTRYKISGRTLILTAELLSLVRAERG
jgi:hypothetical protein